MFWLTHKPSVAQAALFEAVLSAHAASAWRENASTVALLQAAGGSGDYTKAIAAALMTLGGNHAPLLQTHALLGENDATARVHDLLRGGGKVPGWGNSFAKGRPDEHWADVSRVLRHGFPGVFERVAAITRLLHGEGRLLWPNPGAWTASAGIALEMEPILLPYLFLQGRLPAWSQLILQLETRRDR